MGTNDERFGGPAGSAGPSLGATAPEVGGTTGKRRGRRSEPRPLWRTILEWIGVAITALVIATLLRTFVVQTFWIPTGSMIPTLQENDRVVVNKLSYKLHGVHRKDIVVFTTPPGVPKDYKDLIKRVKIGRAHV